MEVINVARRKSSEEVKIGLEVFFQSYLEGYRERVNNLYPDEYSESNSFVYMQPIHLYVFLRGDHTHLLFANGESDKLIFKDCDGIDNNEFDYLSKGPDKLKQQFIQSHLELEDYITVFPFPRLGEWAGVSFTKTNLESLPNSSRNWGIKQADDHYDDYRLVKSLEKALATSSDLNVVNTDDILKRVKDPSFQYEFGESAKAYNAGLYLAAAATGGIALENILRLIIKEKTTYQLPYNTYIKDSLAVLQKDDTLSKRLYTSVESLKNIRNSNAHTNIDPVKNTTVDHLFATIEDLSIILVQ